MDRKFKLTIELVPATVWLKSIYKIYEDSNRLDKWKEIKNKLFETEGRRCWVCGREEGRLEAHEFWEYDDKNHVQKLIAIHHLCDMCHRIKHIGFWCHTEDGKARLTKSGLTREDLINHFCRVNNCAKEDFEKHEDETFRIWEERSRYRWKQDFGDYYPKKK